MGRSKAGRRKVTLPNLLPVTAKKSGKTYWYYRTKSRPLVPMPDLPHDHPDFLHAYAEAREQAPLKTRARTRAPGTVAAIADAVQRTKAWDALAPGYRRLMILHLTAIAAHGEAALIGDLRRRHVEADLAALTPAVSRNRLKAWRLILRHAAAAELIDDDPTAQIRLARMPAGSGIDGWTDAEIAAFRTRWPLGTVARARMELLLWTGAAVSDAVRLGRGMVDRDGMLTYRRQKTAVAAHVPWTAALPDFAAGWEAQRATLHEALAPFAGHLVFLPARGKTRSAAAMVNDVRADARAAGVEKSAHGLRVARSRLLHEAGATQTQAKAWLAHLTDAEASHYSREADRRRAVMGTPPERSSEKHVAQGEKPR
jgi:integrase/recombinase XerD